MSLVSIITPSYNQAQFLEQTMRSVLEQDYAEIEYLVVDGGSTDGSVEIIRKYGSRLAWWVSERDQGQAEAINKGFARARGEIIAWLNSDDLYLPEAVSTAVGVFQAHPQAGLVFGDAITIDPHGHPLNRLAFGNWGLMELLRFRIICQPAVFMRREVLEQAGYLEPSFHFMLDHHLWLRLARIATPQYAPALWAAARQHPQAKNVSQAVGFSRETWQVLEWLCSQPEFAELVRNDRRRVEAGAYRLSARYLLDGGQPGPALKHYMQALRRNPRFALGHTHRMLYALLCLVGGQTLGDKVARLRKSRRPDLSTIPGIDGWPGIMAWSGVIRE